MQKARMREQQGSIMCCDSMFKITFQELINDNDVLNSFRHEQGRFFLTRKEKLTFPYAKYCLMNAKHFIYKQNYTKVCTLNQIIWR